MSNTPLLPVIAGALLCAALPVRAQPAPPDFPEGPGKSTVVALCGGCHDINRLRAGYTPAGWRTVMRMMLNFDVPVPKDQIDTVTDYLIKSFPERPRPAAVIVEGPVRASIKLWPVPTPGSRPHDPLATRDGAIWYTGQLAGKLGRLDPKTGEIKEFPLKTPHTGPHGLAEDKDGNIWFTGNHLGLVGKLDPRTGAVTEYRMPDPKAKDPHTIAIDPAGTVWFTAQNANMVGRIDPKSGEVKLVTSPTPNSRPYGLVINSKGIPVFVEFGSNKIATIDPATLAIKEYPLPNAASRPRRLALTPDDAVWYADFSRGYLGRLDLASGAHAGMALAERAALAALRHRLRQGRALVQQVRRQAEYHRALRPEDAGVPVVGDPRRRRYRAQHERDARRQSGDRQQPGQRGRPRRGEVTTGY